MTTTAIALRQDSLPAMLGMMGPIQSLDQYIRFAHSVPMLAAEEEKTLAERLRQFNDLEAARKLILSHLRFVIKIARGFSGYHLPMEDLIQEGNIGLMKAVKRFDPSIGVRLVSFAVHWIKSEIHEFIIKNWRIVKVATTKAQRKLFFNLRASKQRLGFFSKKEIAEVAKELNVKPSEVVEMEQRMSAYDASFDAPVEEDAEEHNIAPVQYLTAEGDPETTFVTEQHDDRQLSLLTAGLKKLDARSQDIIQQRWLVEDKATLHDLAAKYNISAERVRQLETQAMATIKKSLLVAA